MNPNCSQDISFLYASLNGFMSTDITYTSNGDLVIEALAHRQAGEWAKKGANMTEQAFFSPGGATNFNFDNVNMAQTENPSVWVDGVTVEEGDAGGGVDATEYVGGALGVGSEVMFSDKFGTWMGKDGKIRNQNWGGNGRTGGKFKFAGKVGKFLKWCGTVIEIYEVVDTYVQYKHNEIDGTQLIIEQISNGIGFIPTFGIVWSIGWNLGKDFGPSTWYGKNDYKWFE